ncbi:hypothetical protein [Chitinimonas sp. BJB300]|uniref:hypothetical protein n=1 Tax=Chitinimonas sp. BJB300 TaxID=1559339 RepID=UPI000C0F3ADC|nr:hypothetical protein [Chitinimonas sp. BJB300]PHV10416.1 hypothetical protein CSQ89_16370 [Chitinimonas sp. BJB300]TSJ88112.1 hypothetical protein FG002_011340 [Chitinimonas sp. BJB300]
MINALIPWPYRLLGWLCLVLVIGGAAYLRGCIDEQAGQAEMQLAQLQNVVKVERQQAAISQQIAQAHEVGRAHDRVIYRTIEKEVIRYVANPSHVVCRLDPEWVRHHDVAALSVIPGTASSVDAAASALTSDDALVTVTRNYAACQDNARQLTDLQTWVRQQTAIPQG